MPFDWEAELEALDEVPEKFRGLYAKGEGGKFALDEDLGKRLDTSGLNTALEKERKAKKELAEAQKAWTKLGKSPEEVEKLLGEMKASLAEAQKGKDGAVNFEKLKTDLEAGHAKTVSEKDAEVQRMRGSLHEHLVDAQAIAALSEAKGSVDMLLPHVQRRVKVFEEGGKFLARVVDSEGDPRGNGKGGFMTMKELVEELRKDPAFARGFEPSGVTGSGMRPGATTGGKPGGTEKLAAPQRIAAALASRRRG
ncbi:hypothetical protein [Myxococcus sp. CA040A]|uniref:hypothetical protein n=1 Tax=Myxococcus sp. CA040A TaxID=2741738 RepID=UPI00157B4856|nr:hypothetical protein [Myxococcus sp. CA040A]NTX07067.1 hypothetical protein [Myxococcus sp. CA040A]